MSAQSIYALLEALGCDFGRSSWTVRCPMPNHGNGRGDRNPSLGVALTQNGIGLKCGTGCNTEAIVAYLGFEMRDLFVENAMSTTKTPHVSPLPLPVPVNSSEEGRSELDELLEAHRRGDLDPEEVILGDLPKRASEDHRRVTEDLRFLFGLRRADRDLRPLPYSTTLCAARMGWDRRSGQPKASRILRQLVHWGVIDHCGYLPPRPGIKDRTKTYWPPLPRALDQGSVSVESSDEPRAEVPHCAVMDLAEPGIGVGVAVNTAGDDALPLGAPVIPVRSSPLGPLHGSEDSDDPNWQAWKDANREGGIDGGHS